jgi:uncharacterized protein (DUF1778 family)
MIVARARTAAKNRRLEARITAEQKALIERAAALTGRNVTDFVVASVQAAAEDAIRSHEVMTLSAEDSLAFAEAILNPPPPNENLIALAQEYKEFLGE